MPGSGQKLVDNGISSNNLGLKITFQPQIITFPLLETTFPPLNTTLCPDVTNFRTARRRLRPPKRWGSRAFLGGTEPIGEVVQLAMNSYICA